MEKLALPKDQCIVVEDSAVGLQAARGSGAIVVCKKENRFPAYQDGADYYIDDLLQLLELIDKLK